MEQESLPSCPPTVHVIVPMDERRVIDTGTERTYHGFKDSGIKAHIAQMVRDETVIVGYQMAKEMGGKPPGKRVIVFCEQPPSRRYSRSRNGDVVRRPPDIWRGAEVVYSMTQVFAAYRYESAIYVLGGKSLFLAFWPYISTVHKFVLNDVTIPSNHLAKGHAYFYDLPHGPLVVNRPCAAYRIETYTTKPALSMPLPGVTKSDMVDVIPRPAAARTANAWPHISTMTQSRATSASARTPRPARTVGRVFADEDVGASTGRAQGGAGPLPPFNMKQIHTCKGEDKALREAIEASLKDVPPQEGALDDVDFWQFLIQEGYRTDQQHAGGKGCRPRTRAPKDDIKGKGKLSDDDQEDDAADEEEATTAKGLIIRPITDEKDGEESRDTYNDIKLDADITLDDSTGDPLEDEEILVASDVDYDPEDYSSGSSDESDDDGAECS